MTAAAEGSSSSSHRDRGPRVASIDAGRPFLPTLVRALLDGDLLPSFRWDGRDPVALADALILVPTRRAARALEVAFLAEIAARGGPPAMLLPTIRPFGDVDADEDLFADDDADEPVATPLERRLVMARLVLGWTRALAGSLLNPATGAAPTLPSSPAEAVRLSTALLTLMDQVVSQGVDWRRLDDLVPEDHAAYWQMTRAFLAIVADTWPRHLAERGLADPAVRRHAAVRREAARLAADPPKGPVIAAGSTGSVPSTAELIATVSRLPAGVVVLPGLDFDLDEAAWDLLEPAPATRGDPVPGHPQYGLRLLLDRLGVARSDVRRPGGPPPPAAAARLRLLSESLRPAETSDTWAHFAARIRDGDFDLSSALAGLALIEAESETEEALAVALALREAIEDPTRTAALVTPDRILARRVAAELARWGLDIDDSAGRPFGHTCAALLARLVAEVALGGYEPAAVAALLAHPLARFGRSPREARRLGRIVELVVLRAPRPRPFGRGLLAAYDERVAEITAERSREPRPLRRLGGDTLAAARDLLAALVAALEPLESLAATGDVAVPVLLAAHVAALAVVARDDTGSDAALYDGEDGAALAAALAELTRAAASEGADLAFDAAAWPGFFDALLGDAPVRRPTAPDARIFVFGPLEARLLSFDLVVLAGLDEGVWPITTRTDPWLSRPMRRDMALEAPERRIGLSAHDYTQGASAPRVVLARAARAGGAPTVASRWLQRLVTLIGAEGHRRLTAEADRFLDWARALDAAAAPPRSIGRPSPRPPVEWRPTKLSVTEIETWIRDPYAVHARHVLGLDPLDPLGGSLGAAERGTFVHAVLADFVATWNGSASPAEAARLAEIAERRLAAYDAFPEIVALWRPRLAAVARWWLGADAARSPLVAERRTEVPGRWVLPVDGVPFVLTGVADRIDLMHDGAIAVLDYKTGRPPSDKEVRSLLAPQLPLEAAMARAGAFGPDLAGRPLAELAYLHLKGGEVGGTWERRGAAEAGDAPETLAAAAHDRLADLVRAYRDPATGWTSRRHVRFEKDRSGPYDHLARVAEWAAGELPEGGDA